MKIIECPRDAMQGMAEFIPTEDKVRYLQALLRVGFDTIDFGSFVSPKAIPQMRDTADVIRRIDMSDTRSSMLAIVANTRGAIEASSFDLVNYIGFPLSISETFQRRNTNKSIGEALNTLMEIKELCQKGNKKLVTYISMGFGNPYGDPYDASMVLQFIDILTTLGTDVISLADTVGAASPEQIKSLIESIAVQQDIEIGVHLHSSPQHADAKIKAAVEAGCARIDGALMGFGGCPMAKDDLVGNIATERIVDYLVASGHNIELDMSALKDAMLLATQIFPKN